MKNKSRHLPEPALNITEPETKYHFNLYSIPKAHNMLTGYVSYT